jgi:hypothetical protein
MVRWGAEQNRGARRARGRLSARLGLGTAWVELPQRHLPRPTGSRGSVALHTSAASAGSELVAWLVGVRDLPFRPVMRAYQTRHLAPHVVTPCRQPRTPLPLDRHVARSQYRPPLRPDRLEILGGWAKVAVEADLHMTAALRREPDGGMRSSPGHAPVPVTSSRRIWLAQSS